jgi:CRISPR-associated protein Csm3
MSKLSHYNKCTAQIELLTGLHIGGSKEGLKTGGIDNPVIRNPITNQPYIPGSSLKGRFRMSLEVKYGDTTKESKGVGPSSNVDHKSYVVKLFGNADSNKQTQPTRLIFRDAKLSIGSEEYALGEEKIEVKMDREKMAGFRGGNRIQERIPAGARFDFEVMMRVFEGDDEKIFLERLKEAMNMVEFEFLGGSGSRGYGQVKFHDFKCEKVEI